MRVRLGAASCATFLVAALAALPAPATATPRVLTWELHSRYVDASAQPFADPKQGSGPVHRDALKVNVLLPDGYDGKRRFPVLYLFHPHGSDADSWLDPGQGDLMSFAARIGAVIVMPDAGVAYCNDFWNDGSRSPQWEEYFLDQLMPTVEQRLRILPGRRWHAAAGFSMGGYCAAYLASQRPDYFGSVASLSGALDIQRPEWPSAYDVDQTPWGIKHEAHWGDPARQEFYYEGHNPAALVGNLAHTRIYAAVGNGAISGPEDGNDFGGSLAELEIRAQNDDFAAAARGAGLDFTYAPGPGVHNWPRTRQRFPGALDWGLFGDVPENSSEWTFKTVRQSSDAWGFDAEFAKPPETVEQITRNGSVLRGTGSGELTVRAPNDCRVSNLKMPFTLTIGKPDRSCVPRRLALRVRPRTARAGARTHFHFRALTVAPNGDRHRAAGARIRFAGKHALTGKKGNAAITATLHHAARARVRSSGLNPGRYRVRVLPG